MSDEFPDQEQPAETPEASTGSEPYASPVAPPLPEEPGRRAWPWGLLLGLLNFPAIGLLMAMASSVESLWCAFPWLILGGEAVFGAVKLKQDRFFGRVLLFAPVFTIGIGTVAALVFFGICLVVGTGLDYK